MADETYAGFFNSLVGTPQAVEKFQSTLTDYINNPVAAGDRYDRLLLGLTNIIYKTALDQLPATLTTSRGERSPEQVAGTIAIGGGKLTVAMLRAIGTLYELNAGGVPQYYGNVQDSVRKGLGHLWSLARMDRETSMHNLAANHLGLNPRNPLWGPRFRAQRGKVEAQDVNFVNAFKVLRGKRGQLELELRYRNWSGKPRKPRKPREHCPATKVRTEVVPGRTERGLWLYLQAVGEVAMTEIYPRQFEIVRTPN